MVLVLLHRNSKLTLFGRYSQAYTSQVEIAKQKEQYKQCGRPFSLQSNKKSYLLRNGKRCWLTRFIQYGRFCALYTTPVTPHERFFIFHCRSCSGTSLPSQMTSSGSKVCVTRFVRSIKNEPLDEEAKIMHVNPDYANVRYANGREVAVSLRD